MLAYPLLGRLPSPQPGGMLGVFRRAEGRIRVQIFVWRRVVSRGRGVASEGLPSCRATAHFFATRTRSLD